jgi:signal transduction histidine kinase
MEKSEHRSLRLVITDQGAIVELAVIDRGHGLKDPDRLFEPFYSTKSEGLGMGLNICRTIIESHHGRLWASANPEGGTIFRFTLPCATPAQRPAEDTQELHA